jgi:chaperonin GroES
MERLKPHKDRVQVKRQDAEETTKGGLFVPRSSQEKPLRGAVIAHGNAVTATKVGDTVLFGRYSGQVVYVNGDEFMLLREDELLGTIVSE